MEEPEKKKFEQRMITFFFKNAAERIAKLLIQTDLTTLDVLRLVDLVKQGLNDAKEGIGPKFYPMVEYDVLRSLPRGSPRNLLVLLGMVKAQLGNEGKVKILYTIDELKKEIKDSVQS